MEEKISRFFAISKPRSVFCAWEMGDIGPISPIRPMSAISFVFVIFLPVCFQIL